MPTSRATVPTTRAARYLAQLCSHAGHLGSGSRHHMAHGGDESPALVSEAVSEAATDSTGHIGLGATECDFTTDTTGRIRLGAAHCELTADATGLTLVVTADDPEQLRRLRTALTRTLERIGRRDGLTVAWDGET